MKKNFLLSLTILTSVLTNPVFSMEGEEQEEWPSSTASPRTELGNVKEEEHPSNTLRNCIELGTIEGLELVIQHEIIQTPEGRYKPNSLDEVKRVLAHLKSPVATKGETNYEKLQRTLFSEHLNQFTVTFVDIAPGFKNPEWPAKEPKWIKGGEVPYEVSFTKLEDENESL
ncbi:MAG: hypothetical protein BGO67_04180 [Alphaproteobacteria bacterium 41-28]|nr:MAG: hypothetical protein BGO67_04180 [Alphaproteobacteria bacterium 41-28]